ncbi:MAG: glycosyltransferase family 4 protein, partial [Akkermansia sp.]|nr:glycosyltransferase family 4 protein [Akkermansia sp.]
MSVANRPKIAILCRFPISFIESESKEPSGYHCVWLIVLHKILRLQNKYDIHWITLDKATKTPYTKDLQGQTFHILPKARMTIGLWTRYAFDRWQIHNELKKISPDIVHAWGTEDCYGLAASRYSGKKILSIQGLLIAYAQRANIARFEQRQGRLYEEITLRRFSHITVESEWGKERVKELNPNASVRCWEYAIADYFYHQERALSAEPFCVIAGSNTPVKNVKCAIEAFSKPELGHVKLYMAGVKPGDYNNLPHNIIPLGFVPHTEMTKLLSSCWALIHPSLADTCPNIVKESRVMGLPVVVTTECGAKQYICHEKSGYVVSSDDAEAIAQAVLALTENKEKNLSMGEHDRERCRIAISQ